MRRALAMSLVLLALPAAAQGSFTRWRKNLPTAKRITATLTSDNCTGAAQKLSDGSAITWTRATAATCTKNDGSLVLLSSGQPRCNSSGCLVEGAATNVVQRSEAFDNAYWGGGGHQGTSFTADQAVAPDGNTTADQMTLSAGAGNKFSAASTWSATCAQNTGQWEASIFAKEGTVKWLRIARAGSWQYVVVDTHAGSVFAVNTDGSGTNASRIIPVAHVVAVTNGWFRVDVLFNCEIANSDSISLSIADTSTRANSAPGTVPSFTAAGTETMYLWGAQGVVGTQGFVTSYIPTTSASVTRNADAVSFTKPSWLLDKKGCVSVSTLVPSVAANARALSFASGGSVFAASATSISATDSTNTISSTVTSIAGRSVTLRSYWTGSTLGLVADGVSSTGSYDGTLTGTTVSLGSTAGSSNFLYGLVGNLKMSTLPAGCQ